VVVVVVVVKSVLFACFVRLKLSITFTVSEYNFCCFIFFETH